MIPYEDWLHFLQALNRVFGETQHFVTLSSNNNMILLSIDWKDYDGQKRGYRHYINSINYNSALLFKVLIEIEQHYLK